ncbi:MAG: diguanylate cyclase [Myxococcota bacterium]
MEFDELTGLPWSPRLPQHEARMGVFIDIDGFIWMNDSYGYVEGELFLVRLAALLGEIAAHVSASVYRLGSDEFMLVLPDGAGPEVAESCAQRAVEAVSRLRILRNPKREIEAKWLSISAVVGPVNHRMTQRMGEVREWLADELWKAKKDRPDRTQVIVRQPEIRPPWLAL